MPITATLDAANRPLVRALAANWWLILLRGIAGVIFGILAFMWPGITVLSLTFLWGAYALVDGIASLWAAITGGGAGSRGWLLIVGLLGIVAGLVAFVWPVGTAGCCSSSSPPGRSLPASCRSGARSGCARRSRGSGC